MKKQIARKCGNCKWAKWELTDKGNPRRAIAGRCLFPIPPLPPMPDCVVIDQPRKCFVWMDKGTECPTFEPNT